MEDNDCDKQYCDAYLPSLSISDNKYDRKSRVSGLGPNLRLCKAPCCLPSQVRAKLLFLSRWTDVQIVAY